MKLIICVILTCSGIAAFAQKKSSTVSISHYPNAELYLKADVVCRLTDKSGKPSANGAYLSIENKGEHEFRYSPAGGKNVRTVSPGQKVITEVKRNGSFRFVPLKVTYTNVRKAGAYKRLEKLRQIHSESDQLVFKDQPQRQTYNSRTSKKPKTLSAKTTPAKRSGEKGRETEIAKRTEKSTKQSTRPNPNPGSKKTEGQLPDSLRCMHTSSPSYYTFYYLKVNNDVLFSNVFAVPKYTIEEEGLDLLEQAWLCFVPALRPHLSEQRIDEMLNDTDNDLQLGLLHLRDPFIPSETIAERYPYTRSMEAAQLELESWIAAEKKKFPGVRFVKISL